MKSESVMGDTSTSIYDCRCNSWVYQKERDMKIKLWIISYILWLNLFIFLYVERDWRIILPPIRRVFLLIVPSHRRTFHNFDVAKIFYKSFIRQSALLISSSLRPQQPVTKNNSSLTILHIYFYHSETLCRRRSLTPATLFSELISCKFNLLYPKSQPTHSMLALRWSPHTSCASS